MRCTGTTSRFASKSVESLSGERVGRESRDMYLSIYLYIRDADIDVSVIETQPSAGDKLSNLQSHLKKSKPVPNSIFLERQCL